MTLRFKILLTAVMLCFSVGSASAKNLSSHKLGFTHPVKFSGAFFDFGAISDIQRKIFKPVRMSGKRRIIRSRGRRGS